MQAGEAGIEDQDFIEGLASVNFQMGAGWREKFPNAWKAILNKDYEEAAEQVRYKDPGNKRQGESDWMSQTPERAKDFIKALRGLEKFASGGPVTEQNTDTVPAMLTPGEFVIRKDAADQIGPEKLHMLNNIDRLSNTALLENAKSPMGYQKGGLVGMLGDFISGQKETWGRAKTMEEETGVRNPFLRTVDEQLAQMQGAGTVPKGGWLEKKLAQASADNPELAGPSRPEIAVTPAEIGREPEPEFGSPLNYQIGEADPETEKAYIESLIDIPGESVYWGSQPSRELAVRGKFGTSTLPTLDPEASLSESAMAALGTERAYKESMLNPPGESVWWGSQPSRELTARGESGTVDLPTLDPEANLSEAAMAALATERAYEESMLNPPGESVWWGSQVGDLGIRGESGSEALANLSQLTMKEPPTMSVSDAGLDVSEFHRGSKDPYRDEEKPGFLEWLSNVLGSNQGGYIHGYQEGGEVMNYQNGGQAEDALSVFGEKSKHGDEMKMLLAMAAMQEMQRAQQVQQAIGMQGGGYADEYQQGGAVQPPMPSPEAGPQEVPMSGGDQTYYKPAMEQLDMDQYEYASYVEHGPDMYKWMAPKYKSKQQWTPYDALVDAGTIDPYEIDKDELNVVTNDQLEALSNQARESMRV